MPVSSMHDEVFDVRRLYSKPGPVMIFHSWRLNQNTKRTLFVLEVVEPHILLQGVWQDGWTDLSAVHQIRELPNVVRAPPPSRPAAPRAIDAGIFHSHTGVAVYAFPLERLRACLSRHSQMVQSAHQGRFSWRIRPCENIDPACRELLLAALHERTHFVQGMSTPYGALQWRTLQAILSTAGFLLRKVTDSDGIARTVFFPMVEWYAERERRDSSESSLWA